MDFSIDKRGRSNILLIGTFIFVFLLSLYVQAQSTQFHRLSQILPLVPGDTNLVMEGYNLTNISGLTVRGGYSSGKGLTLDELGNILTMGNLTYRGGTFVLDTVSINDSLCVGSATTQCDTV